MECSLKSLRNVPVSGSFVALRGKWAAIVRIYFEEDASRGLCFLARKKVLYATV